MLWPNWPSVCPPAPSKYSDVVSKKAIDTWPKQLLPMAVEVLFDGIRSGAAVGDLLAEPNHRAVGVIERQLFSAGNAEAVGAIGWHGDPSPRPSGDAIP